MHQRLRSVILSPSSSDGMPRECSMSIDLFQNARQTMGELRDLLRAMGLSWDFIQHEIDIANTSVSPVDKTLHAFDDYTTGVGKSLHNLPSNIW